MADVHSPHDEDEEGIIILNPEAERSHISVTP
jgi:hypothetical protein